MAYYKSLEDMFRRRAEQSKKYADREWAQAKSGMGGEHYGKAKAGYESAKRNEEKAEQMKKEKR